MWNRLTVGLLALSLVAGEAHAATVTVRVHELRNSKGQVIVEFCDQANYLRYTCPGRRIVPADAKGIEVTYGGALVGKYAVTVFHDENSDGHMNTSNVGMPIEGWGASRDPQIVAGPPAFADTAVDVTEPSTVIDVKMHYGPPT